ncbi:MAG: type II toxin-antitoxin system PemK/MazF family toxin [Helicobacteraceae bacterium]|nr:type II toxin-antitoxin system PemK/MazF family toxin [Candidatus Sulfurimonas ponti]
MNTKDIYLVDLNPTKGAEINKARPCIVVSNDDVGVLPLKIVVPLIAYKEHHNKSWLVKIEPTKNTGLSKDSTADPMHIRSVSHDRILKKIGSIDDSTYVKLKEAIKVVLDLHYE